MKSLVLDTSVLIDFLRAQDKEKSLLYTLVKRNYHLSISIITHSELYAGASVWESKKAALELEMLLSGLTIIPLTPEISRQAGKIRTKYHIQLIDSIIAATAIEQNSPVVTRNAKDFERVPRLKLY